MSEKVLTPFQEFWYFFRQNKGAVAGLIVIGLFTSIALLAPFLAPHGEAAVLGRRWND